LTLYSSNLCVISTVSTEFEKEWMLNFTSAFGKLSAETAQAYGRSIAKKRLDRLHQP